MNLRCPSCDQEGDLHREDQAQCTTPACRVTTFQITTPPDAVSW
jgi:hypothetical protein